MDNVTFTCQVCGQTAQSEEELQNHMTSMHATVEISPEDNQASHSSNPITGQGS